MNSVTRDLYESEHDEMFYSCFGFSADGKFLAGAVGRRGEGRFLKAAISLTLICLLQIGIVSQRRVRSAFKHERDVDVSISPRTASTLPLLPKTSWYYGGCATDFRDSSVIMFHAEFD